MGGIVEAIVASALIGGGISYMQGEQQKKAADEANRLAAENARKQEKAADEATNRANQKRPDTSAILSAASQSSKTGASGTMLTGPQGIDPAALNLGKNTLLGS